MLKPLGIEVAGAAEFNLSEPEETGVTFAENALLKAHAAAYATGLPALADDSGFCTQALYGGPGIYSARYANEHGGWDQAMQAVLKSSQGKSQKCWFICNMALVFPQTNEKFSFEGIIKGSLAESPQGENGFGYDPIFLPDGYDQTFGQMLPDQKNAISHRAQALEKLLEFLKNNEKTTGT